MRAARLRESAVVERLFRAAGAKLGGPVAVVAFKHERTLELWGLSRRARRYVRVASFPFLGTSGALGPKRRSGDHQIPEGIYRVTALNPVSLYHLSLGLDYPNASDRALGDRVDPGGDIFIHGDAVSDGCIPIGDRGIERLYLAVLDSRSAGHEVPVAILPCRFEDAGCRAELARDAAGRPGLAEFWAGLGAWYGAFERSGAPPPVSVDGSGRYVVLTGAGRAGSGGHVAAGGPR